MADNALAPVAVQIGVAETTVYTTPAATQANLIVHVSNATLAQRTINAYLYTGAGPGGDANRFLPEGFVLAAGQKLELGPLYLTAGYKVTMDCDVANGVTAIPIGIETT
jgi:hypothetical protein